MYFSLFLLSPVAFVIYTFTVPSCSCNLHTQPIHRHTYMHTHSHTHKCKHTHTLSHTPWPHTHTPYTYTHTHTHNGHTHTHTPWPVLVVSWEISFSNLARNSISVAKRRCVPLSTRMKWVWLGSKNDCFDFCSPWIRYIAGHFPVTCMQRNAATNTLHKAVHNHLPAHYIIIIIIDNFLYSTILWWTKTHCTLKHHPSDTFCPVHWN